MAQVGRLAQELFRISGNVAVEDQKTAGSGGLEPVSLPVENKVPDQIESFLGNLAGSRFRAVFNQDCECVAGESGQGIALANPYAQVAGQFPQIAVASATTGQIVKAFEFIKVQIEQAVAGFPVGFLLRVLVRGR